MHRYFTSLSKRQRRTCCFCPPISPVTKCSQVYNMCMSSFRWVFLQLQFIIQTISSQGDGVGWGTDRGDGHAGPPAPRLHFRLLQDGPVSGACRLETGIYNADTLSAKNNVVVDHGALPYAVPMLNNLSSECSGWARISVAFKILWLFDTAYTCFPYVGPYTSQYKIKESRNWNEDLYKLNDGLLLVNLNIILNVADVVLFSSIFFISFFSVLLI